VVPIGWNTPTVDQIAQNAGVQGNDTLYLSASEQTRWTNNLVFDGTNTTGGFDPILQGDARRGHESDMGNPNATNTTNNGMTPEQYIAKISHEAGIASQFSAEAGRAGNNPQAYASQVLNDPNADQAVKEKAQAYLAYTSLQDSMSQAGLYTTAPVLGSFRPEDLTALHNALNQYFAEQGNSPDPTQGNPQTFSEFLSNMATTGAQNGINPASPGSSSGSTAHASLTDAPTAAMLGDTQAQAQLGRSLGSDAQSQLLGAIHGQETTDFLNGNGGGSSYRTPEAIARDWVVQNNLPEYTQHQALSYMTDILHVLAGNTGTPVGAMAPGDVALGG
jgi:hypothetical protein